MNTSDNIISEIVPERIFRGLYDKATNKRKKQSLEKVNNACKNQYNLKSMDFSRIDTGHLFTFSHQVERFHGLLM